MQQTIHHTTTVRSTSDAVRRRRRRALVLPAIAIAAFAAAGDRAAAEAPELACGTVVTEDVQLAHDLVDCPGAGLIIGASGVTVDLGGHTIDGVGVGAGIDNGAGHDDVTVANGTVREFVFGVHLFDTRGARISGFVAEANLDGVKIERSSRVTIDGTTARDNEVVGMEITFSERVTVRDSSATGSLLGGVIDRYSTATVVERSVFSGNVGPGITVDSTRAAAIWGNDVSANDSTGIHVREVEWGSVARNTSASNSGSGIEIDGGTVHVGGNQAVGNGEYGILVTGEARVFAGRNTASDNGAGDCEGLRCR
jgi:nitrous oxidase accessory protein NosD